MDQLIDFQNQFFNILLGVAIIFVLPIMCYSALRLFSRAIFKSYFEIKSESNKKEGGTE